LVDFINILAICHTIIIENKNGVINYNASSPDELALTNAARFFGFVFDDRDEDNNVIIHHKETDTRLKYELLDIIEFTSSRKRMTVIVKDP
jgi:magnesium-transporting ATPase (P-type)